jgi:hypothetical protein
MPDAAPQYRIVTRIARIAEGIWSVGATASLVTQPRYGMINRMHACATPEQAEDFLEILVDQVRTAVETSGGVVVSVERATG